MAHPASYPKVTGAFSLGESSKGVMLSTYLQQIKKTWIDTSTPPYIIMI
jgi:hypothetical protein